MNVRANYQSVHRAFRLLSRLFRSKDYDLADRDLQRYVRRNFGFAIIPHQDGLILATGDDLFLVMIPIPADGDLFCEPIPVDPDQMLKAMRMVLRARANRVMFIRSGDNLLVRAGSSITEVKQAREQPHWLGLATERLMDQATTIIETDAKDLAETLRFNCLFLREPDALLYLYVEDATMWLFSYDRYRCAVSRMKGTKAGLNTAINHHHAKLLRSLLEEAVCLTGDTKAWILDKGPDLVIRLEKEQMNVVIPKMAYAFHPSWKPFLREPESWVAQVVLSTKSVARIRGHLSGAESVTEAWLILDDKAFVVKTDLGVLRVDARIAWERNQERKMQVLLSSRYLLEALKAFKGQPVRMTFNTPIDPICFSSPEPETTRLHWLAPMIHR